MNTHFFDVTESVRPIPSNATLAEALRCRGLAWGGLNSPRGVVTILIDGAVDDITGTARLVWAQLIPENGWGALLSAPFADLQDPLSDAAQACSLTPEELDDLTLVVERGASGDFEVTRARLN